MNDSGPIDMMLREIASTYNTPELRAAYRAALTTAAIICLDVAMQVKNENPGRSKGTLSAVGEFGYDIAQSCANMIIIARKEISVRDDNAEG